MIDLKEAVSFDPRERSAMLRSIADKDKQKASFLLKKVINKRNFALLLAPVMLYLASRNFDRWNTTEPIEWNGFRFFAFVFSVLAFIFSLIHLVIQYKRVRTLKKALKQF